MRQFVSGSEQETMRLAREICEKIGPGSLVLFTGDLGAGKTAFVRGAHTATPPTSHPRPSRS